MYGCQCKNLGSKRQNLLIDKHPLNMHKVRPEKFARSVRSDQLLVNSLDESRVPFTDDDLAEQLLLLLFAGYETTASSLSCLMRAFLLKRGELEPWLMEELVTLSWPPPMGIASQCMIPVALRDYKRSLLRQCG